MVEEFGARSDDGAAGAASAKAGGTQPAFHRRGDWDNPSGDEPSVPIIYEPA